MLIRRIGGYVSILVMSAVLAACGGNQVVDHSAADASAVLTDSSHQQRAGQLSGRWLVQSIGDRAIDANKPLVIAFDDRSRVGGIAGCNRFLGAYTLAGSDELALQKFKVTRRICSDPVMMQERLLLNRLENVYASYFTAEGALLLFFDEQEGPIRLARDPASLASSTNTALWVARNQG